VLLSIGVDADCTDAACRFGHWVGFNFFWPLVVMLLVLGVVLVLRRVLK
jgi:hypothetical protein